jgi:YD repeat-containing protein
MNLTSDGSRTLEWDARNQLVAITVATHRSEFTYDGEQRRVRIVEKEDSLVLSDSKVIWCQTDICEERASDATTVTRRLFATGEQAGSTSLFLREITCGASLTLPTVRAPSLAPIPSTSGDDDHSRQAATRLTLDSRDMNG